MSQTINAPTVGGFLDISLGALTRNYRRLKAELKGKDCACVVKADAYGLGMDRVAPALYHAGARCFFVAFLDEGIALRALLPEADIHILGGLYPDTAQLFLDHRLIPVLNSLEQVTRWQNRGPFDLQVDTGMTRLGIAPSDWDQLPRDQTPDVLLSHFACADMADHPLNAHQIQLFDKAVQTLPHHRASLANSSGIFLSAASHFDLGRPGCALYGVNPTPSLDNPMETVVTLSGKIAQIHNVDSQTSVGYGASHALSAGQRIATIGLGYADGYIRSLSSQGTVFVQGEKRPVVGRVSMDAIAVDVTGLPVSEGDWVEVIGPNCPVDDVAARANTIGYEILTSLGQRYRRHYHD